MVNHLGFTYCKSLFDHNSLFYLFQIVYGIIFLDFSDPVSHVFIMGDWSSSLKACNTQLWGKS